MFPWLASLDLAVTLVTPSIERAEDCDLILHLDLERLPPGPAGGELDAEGVG